MNLARDVWLLTGRSIREVIRQPVIEVGNIFIPLFFFFVNLGVFKNVAEGAFGVSDYAGFALAAAILQGVSNTSAGQGIVSDIQKGYFDKLVLTPVARPALVLGRMATDGLRGIVLAAVIIGVGMLAGASIESGPIGVLVILAMSALFSIAYSGIAVALALRTASPQAVQLSFLLFFPLIFLSPAFAPRSVFTGWLDFLATINPVTYVLEGMRSLVLDGWEGERLGKAMAAMGGMAAFTLGLVLAAYRWRKL